MNKSSFLLLQIIFIDDTCVYIISIFKFQFIYFTQNIYYVPVHYMRYRKKYKYIYKDVEFLKVGLFLIKNTFHSVNFCGKTNQIKNFHIRMQKQYLIQNKAYI